LDLYISDNLLKEIVKAALNNTSDYVKNKNIGKNLLCSTRVLPNEDSTKDPLRFVRICYWEPRVLRLPETISFIEGMEMYGILALWLNPKEVCLETSLCKDTEKGNFICLCDGKERSYDETCSNFSEECDFIHLGTSVIQGYRKPQFYATAVQRDEVDRYNVALRRVLTEHKTRFRFAKEIAWIEAYQESRHECGVELENVITHLVNNYGFRFFVEYNQR
jgi:hypothetical protein